MGKHYDENKVVNALAKQGIKTTWQGGFNCVTLYKGRSYGIHTWGKLDYLVNHCKYHILWKESVTTTEDTPRNEKKRKQKSEFKYKKNARKMNS